MGLQPVQNWFPRGATAAEVARKRQTLCEAPEAVVACLADEQRLLNARAPSASASAATVTS